MLDFCESETLTGLMTQYLLNKPIPKHRHSFFTESILNEGRAHANIST